MLSLLVPSISFCNKSAMITAGAILVVLISALLSNYEEKYKWVREHSN